MPCQREHDAVIKAKQGSFTVAIDRQLAAWVPAAPRASVGNGLVTARMQGVQKDVSALLGVCRFTVPLYTYKMKTRFACGLPACQLRDSSSRCSALNSSVRQYVSALTLVDCLKAGSATVHGLSQARTGDSRPRGTIYIAVILSEIGTQAA